MLNTLPMSGLRVASGRSLTLSAITLKLPGGTGFKKGARTGRMGFSVPENPGPKGSISPGSCTEDTLTQPARNLGERVGKLKVSTETVSTEFITGSRRKGSHLTQFMYKDTH